LNATVERVIKGYVTRLSDSKELLDRAFNVGGAGQGMADEE